MLTNSTRWLGLTAALGLPLALTVLSCSSSNAPVTGTGGTNGSGGASSTGGFSAGEGGNTGAGTGGTTAAGGSVGTGGTAGSSSSGSGGVVGSGGTGGHGTGGGGGQATGGTAGRGEGGTPGQGGSSGHAGGGAGGTNCAGHAISFNADVAGNNDPAKAAVLVAFNGSADLPLGNANRTIEFWAYVLTTSWSGDANTMFFYGTNNRKADGFGLDFGGTKGSIDPFTNNYFDNDNQPTGLGTSMNQWVHFAMTWDGTTVRAYVNGVLKASKTSDSSSQTTLMTGMSDLVIGGYPPAYFNGQIDEFRIWNVARSAAEITSTMNHTLVGNEPGLTGYWKFDETSGTTATDSVTSAGHTAPPGMLSADKASDDPTFVVSTAPISCP